MRRHTWTGVRRLLLSRNPCPFRLRPPCTVTYIYIEVRNAGTLADEIKPQHLKNVYPKGITKTRTALDSLLSVERKQAEGNEVSSDLFSKTDDDGNKEGKGHTSDGNATDSSGNGT